MRKLTDFFKKEKKSQRLLDTKSVSIDDAKLNLEKTISDINKVSEENNNSQNLKEENKQIEVKLKEEKKDYFFKKHIKKELVVILLEDNKEVAKYNQSILKIYKSLTLNKLVYIIKYNKKIKYSSILTPDLLANESIICSSESINESCLYDVLSKMKNIMNFYLDKDIEREKAIYTIDSIEIIGVGTCTDNCSISDKEKSIQDFNLAISNDKVKTKYFCLTEKNLINAAELGFHSIIAIDRKY